MTPQNQIATWQDFKDAVSVDPVDGSTDVALARYEVNGFRAQVGLLVDADGVHGPKELHIFGDGVITSQEQIDELLYVLATAGDETFGRVN
jgi:hypothetical protein